MVTHLNKRKPKSEFKFSLLNLVDELRGASPEKRSGSGNRPERELDPLKGPFSLPTRIASVFLKLYDSSCLWHKILPHKFLYVRDGRTFFDRMCPSFISKMVFLRSYFAVLLDFAAIDHPLPIILPLEEQLALFFDLLPLEELDFVAVAKYLVSYPEAKFMNRICSLSELPPLPKLSRTYSTFSVEGLTYGFSGKLLRFVKNRCVSNRILNGSHRSYRFVTTILQSVKRGTTVVPESFVGKALVDHSDDLVKQPSLNHEELRKIGLTTFLNEETIALVPFSYKNYLTIAHDQEISQSANVFSNRKSGGTREYILSEESETSRPSFSSNTLRGKTISLLDMNNFLSSFGENGKPNYSYSTGIKPSEYVNMLNRINDHDHSDPIILTNHVRCVPIREPIKVRVISTGDPYSLFLAKPVQKSLKKILDSHKPFVLTTRPLQIIDLLDLKLETLKLFETIYRGKHDKLFFRAPPVPDLWVSGDYKAATDNLNIYISEIIFDQAFDQLMRNDSLPPNAKKSLYSVCRNTLFDLILEYPGELLSNYFNTLLDNNEVDLVRSILKEKFDITYSSDEEMIESVQDPECMKSTEFKRVMTNGQLMGSILSFNLLCIANYVCYKWAFFKYMYQFSWRSQTNLVDSTNEEKFYTFSKDLNRRLSLSSFRTLPVLVNGDDILFRCHESFYPFWRSSLDHFGFKLSVGKNYVHPNALTVNSEGWWDDGITFHKQDYMNLGLLYGPNNLFIFKPEQEFGIGRFSVLPLWDFYKFSVYNANQPLLAHRRFIHYNREVIESSTKKQQNLFASRFLGGLGFPLPKGIRPGISVKQRKRYSGSLYTLRRGSTSIPSGTHFETNLPKFTYHKLKRKGKYTYHLINKRELLDDDEIIEEDSPPAFFSPGAAFFGKEGGRIIVDYPKNISPDYRQSKLYCDKYITDSSYLLVKRRQSSKNLTESDALLPKTVFRMSNPEIKTSVLNGPYLPRLWKEFFSEKEIVINHSIFIDEMTVLLENQLRN